ncbi:tripartite tricarboxylate transporter permease [Acidaminobacter hydrogenoformans]|uniref:Putative tricarboxylic transport membrane protein n=1 Tax=Acidaminobacter hydrogenoformans DSM 2784 TaxID=1120920 RepID=A0A1G5S2W5_9FIRM|nr:tripartite tricarboxylate transporter permease [Acidaminobacter hydrogenoformans]SCZ80190.1 putative tricarboxylic transport membrane protein [Acidaminobacter hydrogenoformans DSM 2784]
MVLEGILAVILSPACLLVTLLGVIVGIIFGSIPGLSATMAVVLFLPMSFGLEPISGISLLMGLYIGGISGGCISAVLLKIPGTPSSISTVFDGGPMADRGEAGKAIGISILYSFIGGIISLIALIFISPYLAAITLKFTAFEYFSIALFSLTIIASMSGKSVLNGLLSGLLGMALAFVGISPIDGFMRFNFDSINLLNGFDIVAVLIGLFAVTDIIQTGANRKKLAEKGKLIQYSLTGFGISLKEFKAQFVNMMRSALIGLGIGILPGIGGSTSGLLSYSAAQNASKYPEKFGTGIIDGVIASETANNATVGGALIPLLTMGIPGSTVAAVILGGLTIHGITPGPLIFVKNGVFMYAIFTALLVANVYMLIVEYAGLKWFVKLMGIPKHILLPIVMVLCAVGAYATGNNVFDVWSIFAFGMLGVILKKLSITTTPFIIGYILSGMAEENLRRALIVSKGDLMPFITRPISALFLLVAVISVVMIVLKNKASRKATA